MIYLNTSDDKSTEKLLQGWNAGRGARATVEWLVVTINADGTHCLPIIMNLIKENGIDIVSVNLKKPTLDDVFIHYTGRDIRDAGAEKLHRIQPKGRR